MLHRDATTLPHRDAPEGSRSAATSRQVAPGAITALLEELAATPDIWGPQREVLAPGDVVADRFELAREIGRGGFGVVLEAWDRQLSRRVAFKVLRPAPRTRADLQTSSLLEEAEVAAQLQHPNIITVFDVGSCEAGPYLILELLRGETLAVRLERGPLPAREAVRVAVETARGLEHAHKSGVVHRDLKPSNVFLGEDGSVKLLDFGLALVLGSRGSGGGGTPGYMAPEMSRSERGDERSDVFGLGTVLFEMLTGRPAYPARRGRSTVLEAGPEPLLEAPGVRAPLAALVRDMIAKDPGARPRDGGAALDRLLDVERHLVALRKDEAFEARYRYWRRAFLIGGAAVASQLPFDFYYPRTRALVVVRLLWVALALAVACLIHPRRPRSTIAAMHGAALASGVADVIINALSGGSESLRFGFLLLFPPLLLGLFPDIPTATGLMGIVTLSGGVAILVGEGRAAWVIMEWVGLWFLATSVAVVGSISFRRTILGELGAHRARAQARSATGRDGATSERGATSTTPALPVPAEDSVRREIPEEIGTAVPGEPGGVHRP